MFEPHRRNLVAQSMFRLSEIIWGALFVSILFSPIGKFVKLAIVAAAVIIFFSAWLMSPAQFPTEEKHG